MRNANRFSCFPIIVATLASSLLALPVAAQSVRYVATDGDDEMGGGANDCTEPASPCLTVRHAVMEAEAGDTIQIAAGAYTESTGVGIVESLTLAGAGQTDTIIQAHEDPGTASSRVILIDAGAEVGLSDLTIRHGFTTGPGGGIWNAFGTLTLTDVTVSENHADEGGGLMNDEFSTATLTNVDFLGNEASGDGGGMYNLDSSPVLTDVRFTQNQAGGIGGGMLNQGTGSPKLNEVVFALNTAAVVGGGLANRGDNAPELIRCGFAANVAGVNGGGLWNRSGDPVLIGPTFLINRAGDLEANTGKGGGFYADSGASLSLKHGLIIGNTAGEEGGGSFLFSASAELVNAAYLGNFAGARGGGMQNEGAISLSLINASFGANLTGGEGGAMYNQASSPGLSNVIFWNNQAEGVTDSVSATVFNDALSEPEFSYSLVANSGGSGAWNAAAGVDGGHNLDEDPLFVVTPDPGAWPDIPGVMGDPRLTGGSPAVDAGDPATGPAQFVVDEGGDPVDLLLAPRFVNTIIDMGALEWPGDAVFSDRFEN